MARKKWYEPIEKVVKKLILPLIVILLFLIIGEIFFYHELEPYHFYIQILDFIIVFVFILDLLFTYLKIRKFWPFLKKSWLDIIAVFPFFLVFRAFERMYLLFRIPEELKEGQMILHEGLEVEKKASRFVKETRIARSEKFLRFIRPGARSLRLAKGIKERKKIKRTIKKQARKSNLKLKIRK